jgi:hypothetical protein
MGRRRRMVQRAGAVRHGSHRAVPPSLSGRGPAGWHEAVQVAELFLIPPWASAVTLRRSVGLQVTNP